MAEIAAVKAQVRAGHPDWERLSCALGDWSAESRLMPARMQDEGHHHTSAPPGAAHGAGGVNGRARSTRPLAGPPGSGTAAPRGSAWRVRTDRSTAPGLPRA